MKNLVQQLKTNKSLKKKLIWTSAGIIVLLIVVMALSSSEIPDEDISFVATDKSPGYSEQSGNLYRNTKYNFRIKFPEGWDIKPGDGPNILQKAVNGNNVISVGVREIPAEFGDRTATIKDTMTLDEFKNDAIVGLPANFLNVELLDYGETTLDNEPSYWIKYVASYSAPGVSVRSIQMQYVLIKNNIFYFIGAGSDYDKFPSAEPEFMKSIITFVIEDWYEK